eukprot:13906263-Ditylum_brightwellii.AAC.1
MMWSSWTQNHVHNKYILECLCGETSAVDACLAPIQHAKKQFKLFKEEPGKSIISCPLGHPNCPYYMQLEDTYLELIPHK